jgi:hypothetical protein
MNKDDTKPVLVIKKSVCEEAKEMIQKLLTQKVKIVLTGLTFEILRRNDQNLSSATVLMALNIVLFSLW